MDGANIIRVDHGDHTSSVTTAALLARKLMDVYQGMRFWHDEEWVRTETRDPDNLDRMRAYARGFVDALTHVAR